MSEIALERATATLPTKTFSRQSLKWALSAGLAGLLVLGAARYAHEWWSVGRFIETTDDAYVGGNVTPIAPHVDGFVDEILVKDNEHVSAGQMLIKLDERDFQTALDRATAILAQRQATLASLRAQERCSNRPSDSRTPISTPRRRRRRSPRRTTPLPPPRADERRIAPECAEGASALERGRRSRPLPRPQGGARGRAPAARRAGRADRRGATPPSRKPRPTCAPHSSTWATPRSARRSTATSATARPRSAPMSTGGTYLISVIPADELWVDANFKEDQLRRMVAGPGRHRRRRRACRTMPSTAMC